MKIRQRRIFPPRHPSDEAGDSLGYVWEWLVPRLIHPDKLAILEALHVLGEPASFPDLSAMLDGEHHPPRQVRYHLMQMDGVGVVEIVNGAPSGDPAARYFFAPKP
jgi:hypothetical protein